jgi:hypothetical protein
MVMSINLNNKPGFLVLGLLLLILLAFMRWDGQILQFAFFLRVPLIAGLLLFFLPAICIYLLPTMLGNLFVLSNLLRIAFVIPGAIIVGLGIVLIGAVIGANADERFGVAACAWFQDLASGQSPMPYVLAVVLSVPTLWAVFWASGPASEEMTEQQRNLGFVLGILLAALFLGVVYWLRMDDMLVDSSGLLIKAFAILPEHALAGFVAKTPNSAILADGHLAMVSYMLVSVILYFIGLGFYRPTTNKERWQLPALSYVLGLLQIFSLLLGFLTFAFDFYRIPVLLSLLLVSALAYRLWKVDHYYDLRETGLKPLAENDVVTALKNRLDGHDTLVVVCASGGGIQAAGWTTMVLTGLQKKIGPKFTKAIGIISAVSGGSVGLMYFLDRFNKEGIADPGQLEAIFQASTQDSLGATGWGLTYPDLWRIVGLPFLETKPCDRGDAINADWKSEMANKDATLHTWSDPIKAGLLPIPVFNATIVEDGRHYLISPMTFNVPVAEGLEFNTLYKDCDIDVSTAALLSATFPYVTPITRNSVEPKGKPIFHVADGGFFDNYGVVTAVDWLNRLVLPNHKAIGIKRVLFVEIRAFPDEEPIDSAPNKPVGWKTELFGPLLTVFSARISMQNQRNQDDVEDLMQDWNGKGIEVLQFPISFPKEEAEFFAMPTKTGVATIDRVTSRVETAEYKAKKYEPPLSWTLTKKQREAIRDAWIELEKDPNGIVAKLKQAW